MVKPAPRPVNAVSRYFTSSLLIEQALIWLVLGGGAYAFYATGAEVSLAQAVYHTHHHAAWLLRQYGTQPSAALAIVCLLLLFWPRLFQKSPLMYQTAVAVLLTTVLGAGLISQVLVQDFADRARPRESILAPDNYTPPAEFRGNSMPSGHAAMAFVLAAPYFPLRRRKPKLAAAFLAVGITAGVIVGGARMVLGAHYASDVLMAGAITLSSASVFGRLSRFWLPVPKKLIVAAAVVSVLALALGNRFKTDLTLPLPQPFKHINVPCEIKALTNPNVHIPILHVELRGYGAPLSQLRLKETAGVVTIETSRGIYHSLHCTAQLDLPANQAE